MLHQLAAARRGGDAGEDAGIGGGFNDPIRGREAFEIAGVAEIGVNEADALFFEQGAIYFASGPAEVIHAEDVDSIDAALQSRWGKGAAHLGRKCR